MLAQAHIKPLAEYLDALRIEHPGKELPCFDPCDGGIHAKALFLLEAPGPKAVGSTFISRNNPDPTARNMCDLLKTAGIKRGDTLIWNIVPWYVGEAGKIRAVTNRDIEQALPQLNLLVNLLPKLKVIILVGKKAQSAKSALRQMTPLLTMGTHHPSARVFNVWPHKRDEMQADLMAVAALLQ